MVYDNFIKDKCSRLELIYQKGLKRNKIVKRLKMSVVNIVLIITIITLVSLTVMFLPPAYILITHNLGSNVLIYINALSSVWGIAVFVTCFYLLKEFEVNKKPIYLGNIISGYENDKQYSAKIIGYIRSKKEYDLGLFLLIVFCFFVWMGASIFSWEKMQDDLQIYQYIRTVIFFIYANITMYEFIDFSKSIIGYIFRLENKKSKLQKNNLIYDKLFVDMKIIGNRFCKNECFEVKSKLKFFVFEKDWDFNHPTSELNQQILHFYQELWSEYLNFVQYKVQRNMGMFDGEVKNKDNFKRIRENQLWKIEQWYDSVFEHFLDL